MGLSEREREVLAQMEAQMRGEDFPKAESAVPAASIPEKPTFSFTRLVLGVVAAFVGLAIIVAAVALGHGPLSVALGVAGFLVALGGVIYGMSTPRALSTATGSTPKKNPQNPSSTKSSKSASFMQRQQELWERRRRGE